MITLFLLAGCLPPILLDTARTFDTGVDTADTADSADTGADTGADTSRDTSTDTSADTGLDPCDGKPTCPADIEPSTIVVTLDDLSVAPGMFVTPNSLGRVDVAFTHAGEGTGGTAEVEGLMTTASRTIDLAMTLTPSGEKSSALTVSFQVSGLPAGDWTFSDGVTRRTVAVE
jgi:hypothetical protein